MKKKIQDIIFIIFFVILLLIVAPIYVIPIGNNIILNNYTKELKNTKLNADFEIVAKDDVCGKLVGNGNGMQYFSALLIHSEKELVLETVNSEDIFLIKVDDNAFEDFFNDFDFAEYCDNIEKKLEEITDAKNYYVFYSYYEAPLDSIWNDDLRAH
ncbi:hypothetical protein QA584_10520 [Anaerocolumna sp. AGMB13025]|uniref:hypothetical protein n=1 Tax=Anaerocolumna sp. AGMB13025 TaxID=3039116 RepID=UPI00241C5D92|nr:hypothetical protein [Anaerocolumna sp. AGMB13025]WFR59496.1 hypothetical protein QA584_10520 [Anaerocolumna sp. AGMB13025]